MEFHVYENARAACEAAGVLIAAQITRKGDSVLGLATGSTPIPAYEMLTQWYDRGVIDFDRVRTFNLDEYVGIDHKNPLSYHAFMQEHLFSKVNLRKENVHLPSGNARGGCRGVRQGDSRRGRHRHSAAGHRPQRPYRLQRAGGRFHLRHARRHADGGHHRGERPLLQERGRGAASGGFHGHRQHHGGEVRRAGGNGRE